MPSAKKKSARSLQARRLELEEGRARRWDLAVDRTLAFPFFLVSKMFSWPVVWIIGLYLFFVEGAQHFAGEDTSLFVGTLVDIGGSRWLEWTAIVILLTTNVVTGMIFRGYVKRHGQREKELEARLDPDRTSSGLTESGQPPSARKG